jgi:tetratricopeptide (TPR) repeat protein/TolB-like protein
MADFGRELLRRRVPQIVGAYLAGGWILLEFTDWTVNRYVLSSHVTDFVVASWLLLLPAIAILAWNHGSPGRDEWRRAETIGIALNLLFAGVILFSVFRGQDLGAATSTVVGYDEEGRELVRQIPKGEFRQRVALFSFTNGSGDPELDWLQYALPKSIDIDLSQEPFVRSVAEIFREKQGAEPDRPLALPLAQRREIARNWGAESFVTGNIDRADGGIEVRFTLHDTDRGRPVAEHIFAGDEPLALADRISRQLRTDLEIPTGHLEATPDLPVRELLTGADEGLKPFFAGSFYYGMDAVRSRAALEEAVDVDSTFARANQYLGNILFGANELEAALEAFEAAIRHDYKLEESSRFALKTRYFEMSQQPERALSVARLRTDLYPHDPAAFAELGQLLVDRGEVVEALAAFETTIELDPSNRWAYEQVGGLRRDAGQPERAAEAYRALEALDPEAAGPHVLLGDLYLTLARFDEAESEYERARILDPGLGLPSLGLGLVNVYQGRFAAAETHFAEALDLADNEPRRARALEAVSSYLDMRGRSDSVSVLTRKQAVTRGQTGGRLAELQLLGLLAVKRARARDAAGALALLDTVRAELEPPLDGLVDFFETLVHRELEDASALAAGIPAVRGLLESLGLGALYWWGDMLEAESLRMSGRCEDALALYRSAAEAMQEPMLFYTIREMGTDPLTGQAACLRELGRFDEAEVLIREVLRRIPAEPTAHLELARLELARGQRDAAGLAVETALLAWADADAEFGPAAEARELRGALAD